MANPGDMRLVPDDFNSKLQSSGDDRSVWPSAADLPEVLPLSTGMPWCVLLKWLPPHSADPLPQFQFRDCGFVVSGTGFQNFRLRSVGISIFPALELPDSKISSVGRNTL